MSAPGGDRASLGAKVAAFARAADAVASDPGAADSVRRLAHAVRTVAAQQGLTAVASACAAIADAPDDAIPQLAKAVLAAVGADGAAVEGEPGAMVLVVEDDPALQMILDRALTSPGRRVVTAASIADAEQQLAAGTPAVILLDLVLPDGDGRNFLVRLREQPATKSVPVIAVSALRSAQVRNECYALGCDAFLDKPVDVHSVIATVDTLLQRARQAQRPAPETSRAVLLAEDDPVIASLVQHRLTRDGFEVVHEKNGLDALKRAEADRFALAILDVNMPGLGGFGLLERLRALPTHSAMPIMMLTAMGNESDIARALELGASDYVVKPFSPVELLARVRRLVQRA